VWCGNLPLLSPKTLITGVALVIVQSGDTQMYLVWGKYSAKAIRFTCWMNKENLVVRLIMANIPLHAHRPLESLYDEPPWANNNKLHLGKDFIGHSYCPGSTFKSTCFIQLWIVTKNFEKSFFVLDNRTIPHTVALRYGMLRRIYQYLDVSGCSFRMGSTLDTIWQVSPCQAQPTIAWLDLTNERWYHYSCLPSNDFFRNYLVPIRVTICLSNL